MILTQVLSSLLILGNATSVDTGLKSNAGDLASSLGFQADSSYYAALDSTSSDLQAVPSRRAYYLERARQRTQQSAWQNPQASNDSSANGNDQNTADNYSHTSESSHANTVYSDAGSGTYAHQMTTTEYPSEYSHQIESAMQPAYDHNDQMYSHMMTETPANDDQQMNVEMHAEPAHSMTENPANDNQPINVEVHEESGLSMTETPANDDQQMNVEMHAEPAHSMTENPANDNQPINVEVHEESGLSMTETPANDDQQMNVEMHAEPAHSMTETPANDNQPINVEVHEVPGSSMTETPWTDGSHTNTEMQTEGSAEQMHDHLTAEASMMDSANELHHVDESVSPMTTETPAIDSQSTDLQHVHHDVNVPVNQPAAPFTPTEVQSKPDYTNPNQPYSFERWNSSNTGYGERKRETAVTEKALDSTNDHVKVEVQPVPMAPVVAPVTPVAAQADPEAYVVPMVASEEGDLDVCGCECCECAGDYYYEHSRGFPPLYGDVWLGHVEGKGIGYKTGYSTVGLFLTPYGVDNWFNPFLDARFHILNNGEKAFNVGLGGRFYNECLDKVFGLNVYYDYRHSHHDFQDIGVGAEMLGCYFDLRANGYIPIGSQKHNIFRKKFKYHDGFWAKHFSKQKQMGGFDAEIATSLNRFCCCYCYDWDPYIAAGPYYFNGVNNKHVRGGRVRLGVDYADFLNLELRTTFDNVYHTIVQGVITISFPFGISGSCCDCCYDCCCPIYCEPVIRNDIIGIGRDCLWRTNFPHQCQGGCSTGCHH